MIYVVFDLEFIVSKGKHFSDIIEIGAIKLREKEGIVEVDDMYQSFVRPRNRHSLSAKTTEFTSITKKDIEHAPNFSAMMGDFVTWIGDEEYYLIAWGQDDKFQLLKHCRYYHQSHDWIRNYNDFQWLLTMRTSGVKHQRIGLSKALEMFKIPFEGRPHRGIDDAYNTAKLFIHLFPTLILEKNKVEEDYLYTSQLVYQTGDDCGYHPFAHLLELLQETS